MAKKIPAFTPERALLDYLKDADGGGFQTYKVTQGYLKILVLLGDTALLDFQVIQGEQTTTGIIGQQLLSRSDAFWANIFGFFIGKTIDTESPSSIIEETFPNPYVFPGTTELPALRTLYNGQLKIQIDDQLYFQQYDLKRLKFVGVAQRGLEVTASFPYGESQWNPMTGFFECCPNILFQGGDTPQVQIKLPESVDMTGEAQGMEPVDTFNYAILYFRGFYIPSGAKLGAKAKA